MAEDSSVRMETLKKAYAEIILNTSKEAAARIMVADRRALCFEKDLVAVKEEALRLLLQLKQTLDFKTAEAEVKSENQQRKIEELEAQLSEAEGIIVDLREELRMTQDKLEQMKCSQWRPLKRKSSEDSEDEPQPLDNELITKTDDERYHIVQYPFTENARGGKNPPAMSAENAYQSTETVLKYSSGDQLLRSDEEKPSTSFRPSILSRCNASLNRFGDVKASKEQCSSCSSEPDELDTKLASNGSQTKSQEYESHHGQTVREYESHHGQTVRDGSRRNRKNLKYQEAIAALRKSSHGRNAKPCQLPSLSSLTKCRTKSARQSKALIDVLGKNKKCSTPGSRYQMVVQMDHNLDTEQEKSTEFGDKLMNGLREGVTGEKESDCNLNDVHISEDEESAGIPNRADSDKVLKFTFQRKRKRELLTNLDSDTIPDGDNVKSRALLEKGDSTKRQKSSVKDEQSKDGRQLLQIAHQLISLSENGHS